MRILYENNEYAKATQRFTDALILKPDYYAAYVFRARSYKAEGKLEEAKQDLLAVSEKLVISDPLYQQAAEELKNLVEQ
jgi:hypothetical protein